jgi:hypothetical protein
MSSSCLEAPAAAGWATGVPLAQRGVRCVCCCRDIASLRLQAVHPHHLLVPNAVICCNPPTPRAPAACRAVRATLSAMASPLRLADISTAGSILWLLTAPASMPKAEVRETLAAWVFADAEHACCWSGTAL